MSIYFIQCGTNGPIKIGFTNNGVEERISQLQTGCPYILNVLWVYEGNDFTEADIHKEFEHEKIRGEWFRPAKAILDFIRDNLSNAYIIITKNGRSIEFIEFFNGGDCITYLGENAINFEFGEMGKPEIQVKSIFIENETIKHEGDLNFKCIFDEFLNSKVK